MIKSASRGLFVPVPAEREGERSDSRVALLVLDSSRYAVHLCTNNN